MAHYENLPFPRGGTFFGGGTPSTTDGSDNLEGKEYWCEDLDYSASSGVKPHRSGHLVRLRVVRNASGGALLPKQRVSFKATAGNYLIGQVDGKCNSTAQGATAVVDEFLPAAGVAANDLFYVVVEGPAMHLTDLAGGASNLINVGSLLVCLTAVTSGATTAGRVAPQDLTGATANLGIQIQNRIGYALSAKTTANTNADVLVYVTKL